MSHKPTHICLVCWIVQEPARLKPHSRTVWCWVCHAGDVIHGNDVSGVKSTVLRMGPAEQAAYRMGGADAVRELLSEALRKKPE